MSAKLYVGNVSYDVSGEQLSSLFAEVGTVLASRVIVDRVTGKSRGFGFVEMASEGEAEAAIGRFHGYRLLGRTLLVHLAHDNRELSRRAREAKARQREEFLRVHQVHHQPSIDVRAQELRDRMDRMRRPLRRTLRERTV
ncbi:MAG: hypothetical protein AB1489_28930 [Acidobacteriota bacterium]